MPLNARKQAFVDAYTGNGVQAARAAGYSGSDKTLATTASRLLKDAEVTAAIAARRARLEARAVDAASVGRIATRAERQAFWTSVMCGDGDMGHRLKASELLGKSEIDFTEKVKHEGGVTIEIVDPFAEPKP